MAEGLHLSTLEGLGNSTSATTSKFRMPINIYATSNDGLSGSASENAAMVEKLRKLKATTPGGIPHYSVLYNDFDIACAVFHDSAMHVFNDKNGNTFCVGFYGTLNDKYPTYCKVMMDNGVVTTQSIKDKTKRDTGSGSLERDAKRLFGEKGKPGMWTADMQKIENAGVTRQMPYTYLREDVNVVTFKDVANVLLTYVLPGLLLIIPGIGLITAGVAKAASSLLNNAIQKDFKLTLSAVGDVGIALAPTLGIDAGSITNGVIDSKKLQEYTKIAGEANKTYNSLANKDYLSLLNQYDMSGALSGLVNNRMDNLGSLSSANIKEIGNYLADEFKQTATDEVSKLTGIKVTDIDPIMQGLRNNEMSRYLTQNFANFNPNTISENKMAIDDVNLNNFVTQAIVSNYRQINEVPAAIPNAPLAVKLLNDTGKLNQHEFTALMNSAQLEPVCVPALESAAVTTYSAWADEFAAGDRTFIIPSNLPPEVQARVGKKVRHKSKAHILGATQSITNAIYNDKEFE